MITLFGIDESGNSVYTFNGETSNLAEHMKIAKQILDRQPHVHYVAIVLETIEVHARMISFGVDLLHLARRPLTEAPGIVKLMGKAAALGRKFPVQSPPTADSDQPPEPESPQTSDEADP